MLERGGRLLRDNRAIPDAAWRRRIEIVGPFLVSALRSGDSQRFWHWSIITLMNRIFVPLGQPSLVNRREHKRAEQFCYIGGGERPDLPLNSLTFYEISLWFRSRGDDCVTCAEIRDRLRGRGIPCSSEFTSDNGMIKGTSVSRVFGADADGLPGGSGTVKTVAFRSGLG